jgi:hypothetical protein
MYRSVPERIKRWYKRKSNLQFSPTKNKKDMIKQKNNVKTQIKVSHSKTKSTPRPTINKSERIIQKTTPAVTTSKHNTGRKGSLVKSRPTIHEEKKHSKILNSTKKIDHAFTNKNERKTIKNHSQISIVSKSKDQQKKTVDTSHDQPTKSPSTTIATDVFTIDNVPKVQVEKEGINYCIMTSTS